MSEHNYKPGDKVRFIDAVLHEEMPKTHPKPGTVGVVLGQICDTVLGVRWPTESTAAGNKWLLVETRSVEPVEEAEA